MRLHASRYEEDSELSTEIERFKIDIKNSGGFEVRHYPLRDQAQIYCTWICKYYDIPNKPLSAIYVNQLLYFSQLVLCLYNIKEKAHFDKYDC